MFKLTASEVAAAKTIKLKQAINNMLIQHQDEFGFGTISKNVTGWQLELSFTPHSNQAIAFTATNSNGGVYLFELDSAKVNQGHIVINGSNPTASILLSDWFYELID